MRARGICARCGRLVGPAKLVGHHPYPVSYGGSFFGQVLEPLCRPCHADKEARTKALLRRLSAAPPSKPAQRLAIKRKIKLVKRQRIF